MFGEKDTEYSKKDGKEIPVWQSPRYIEAKKSAMEIIKGKKYDLAEGDFWILMNRTSTGKMGYTGLIISHNGCLKINDKLENKVDPRGFSVTKDGYNGSLVYTYCDDDVYEVGEVSSANCKNEYPYAMAFKRCFDRVVLKKCKLAYSGIYSDSEADEFKKDDDKDIEELTITKTHENTLRTIIKNKGIEDEVVIALLKSHGYEKLKDIKVKDFIPICEELKS